MTVNSAAGTVDIGSYASFHFAYFARLAHNAPITRFFGGFGSLGPGLVWDDVYAALVVSETFVPSLYLGNSILNARA